jgi:hypothetical protein
VKLEVPCLPEKLIKEGVVFAPEYKHDSFMFTAKVPAYALIEMSSFLNGGQWPESKCVIKGRLKSDSMHMNLKVCLCVTLAHRERYVEASESERGRGRKRVLQGRRLSTAFFSPLLVSLCRSKGVVHPEAYCSHAVPGHALGEC